MHTEHLGSSALFAIVMVDILLQFLSTAALMTDNAEADSWQSFIFYTDYCLVPLVLLKNKQVELNGANPHGRWTHDYGDLCLLCQLQCIAKDMVLHRFARLHDTNVWQLVSSDEQRISKGSFLLPQTPTNHFLKSSSAIVRAHPWASSTSGDQMPALHRPTLLSVEDRIWDGSSPVNTHVQCECNSCNGIGGRNARCTNTASLLPQLERAADGRQKIMCDKCKNNSTCSLLETLVVDAQRQITKKNAPVLS